jgi:hypothetical protein
MTYRYDFGNVCVMFKGVLLNILVALQDGNTNKAIDTCTKTMKILDKWIKKYDST